MPNQCSVGVMRTFQWGVEEWGRDGLSRVSQVITVSKTTLTYVSTTTKGKEDET